MCCLLAQVIWHEVQKRVGALLTTACQSLGSSLPLSTLVTLVHLTEKFMLVGAEFSKGDSHALSGALRRVTSEYFDNVHRRSMSSLQLMLQGESWQVSCRTGKREPEPACGHV